MTEESSPEKKKEEKRERNCLAAFYVWVRVATYGERRCLPNPFVLAWVMVEIKGIFVKIHAKSSTCIVDLLPSLVAMGRRRHCGGGGGGGCGGLLLA